MLPSALPRCLSHAARICQRVWPLVSRTAASIHSSRRWYSSGWEPRHTKSFPVSQFGLLQLNTGLPTNVRILDGSPECPDVSTDDLTGNVYVYVYDDDAGTSAYSQDVLNQRLRGQLVEPGTDYAGLTLAADASLGSHLTVWVPFSMNVSVETTESSRAPLPAVSLQKMEGQATVRTTDAPVSLKSIKGGYVNVATIGGDITATSLLGDIRFATQTGSLDITKMQALELDIDGGDGSVIARAIYANNSRIISNSAPIKLGAIHGNTTITTDSGSVFIGTTEGSVAAKTNSGDIFVHVHELDEVFIESQAGKVELSLAEELATSVQIDVASVSGNVLDSPVLKCTTDAVDGGLPSKGTLEVNGGGPTIQLKTDSSAATINVRSWFEATMASNEALV